MANGQRGRISAEERERLGETAYKRALAYQCLGTSPDDARCVPFVRSSLKRIARILNQDPLDLLQSSDDPDARAVHNVRCKLPPSYMRLLPLEAFLTAAGVSPWRILEIVTGVAVRQGAQASAIVAAVWHPRVVLKTVERALQDDGETERTTLFRAVGFLPSRS